MVCGVFVMCKGRHESDLMPLERTDECLPQEVQVDYEVPTRTRNRDRVKRLRMRTVSSQTQVRLDMGVGSHLTSQVRGVSDQMPRKEFRFNIGLGIGRRRQPILAATRLACNCVICDGRLGPMPCA